MNHGLSFWVTMASNDSPCATVLLSCMSVTLVYCSQTVEWIKMLLSTEVGLSPGDIVLDVDQLPHERGTAAPSFRSVSIVAKWSPVSAVAELLLLSQPSLLELLPGWLCSQNRPLGIIGAVTVVNCQ